MKHLTLKTVFIICMIWVFSFPAHADDLPSYCNGFTSQPRDSSIYLYCINLRASTNRRMIAQGEENYKKAQENIKETALTYVHHYGAFGKVAGYTLTALFQYNDGEIKIPFHEKKFGHGQTRQFSFNYMSEGEKLEGFTSNKEDRFQLGSTVAFSVRYDF